MRYPNKDFTPQEGLIARVLSDLGVRYGEQVDFYPYTVDFYVQELKWVIEADGPYGHLRKRDRKRDSELLKHSEITKITHIKATTLHEITDLLCEELNG